MTVSEAILLSSRCRQLVICGDPKQLGAPDDQPNLFDHARSLGLPSFMLTKHYRSKSGDLIYFSNLTSYDLALRVVPSPDLHLDHGVSITVPKIVEINQTRLGTENFSEAELVAERLRAYAASDDNRSICVITPTTAQVAVIREAMERHSLRFSDLTRKPDEPFFIRTINDVQGEERDISLISMTYAPQNGSMDGRLGRFEHEGRVFERLNVALSRSRSRTEVFVSFLPAHLAGKDFGPAQKALFLFFQAFGASIISKNAFDVQKPVEIATDLIRRNGDRLDNLGLIHAWARPNARAYSLAILTRFKQTTARIWNAAESQLKIAGWTVVSIEEDDFVSDMDQVQSRIAEAIRK